MSHALIAPEFELFPARYRWSVAECSKMAEEGRLIGRYEVLDGEIVSNAGQKPPHYFCISLLTHWANLTFGDRYVRVQAPIALPLPDGEYSEPEPDVAVTREPTDTFAGRHPGPEDLLVVIEVSDTTLVTDLAVKFRLYARAGIGEYWALDLKGRKIHVYRHPIDGAYTDVTERSETEALSLMDRPETQINVAGLLPDADLLPLSP